MYLLYHLQSLGLPTSIVINFDLSRSFFIGFGDLWKFLKLTRVKSVKWNPNSFTKLRSSGVSPSDSLTLGCWNCSNFKKWHMTKVLSSLYTNLRTLISTFHLNCIANHLNPSPLAKPPLSTLPPPHLSWNMASRLSLLHQLPKAQDGPRSGPADPPSRGEDPPVLQQRSKPP